jgi:hypothetical protein
MRKRKNKGGRPPVHAEIKRGNIFRFVTTDKEAAAIRAAALACGQTLSEYLRSVSIPKS